MMKSRPPFAASTNEAPVYAAGRTRPRRHRRLYQRTQSAGRSAGARRHPSLAAKFGLFPQVGRAQSVNGVSKLVTRRYPYLVYYTVDLAREEIVILTIQHPAREREFEDG
jgi:hypothetical protein